LLIIKIGNNIEVNQKAYVANKSLIYKLIIWLKHSQINNRKNNINLTT